MSSSYGHSYVTALMSSCYGHMLCHCTYVIKLRIYVMSLHLCYHATDICYVIALMSSSYGHSYVTALMSSCYGHMLCHCTYVIKLRTYVMSLHLCHHATDICYVIALMSSSYGHSYVTALMLSCYGHMLCHCTYAIKLRTYVM